MSGSAGPAWRQRGVWAHGWTHLSLAGLALLSAGPVWLGLMTSLLPEQAFSIGTALPPVDEATLANYGRVLGDLGFARMLRNSAILATFSAIIATASSFAAAYGLARYSPRGTGLLLASFVGLIAIPPIIVVPFLFLLMSQLNLVNTVPSAIVAQAALVVPFSTFFLYTYARNLNREQFEAAEVDGASQLSQFWYIAVPLMRPALVANALLVAIYSWNDLITPLMLWQSNSLLTVQVGLASIASGFQGDVSVPLMMAGVVLSIAPLAIVTWMGKDLLTQGLSHGGGK